MVESALDSETHVRGFADRLGERFIVPQPSGSLLEHLHFRPDLSSAPFFEPAVKERLARLANFRHASYTRARRLRSGDGDGLVLVSTHTPGRHLSEVLHTASRNGFRPPAEAVLWLTRQLLTSMALLHDYGPDIFHGALGPERLILPGEGRVVLAEYVLGTAVEQAVGPWGVHHLWRELRLPALTDFNLAGYGRRVDLLQVGLVTLAFFLGRPLAPGEFPEGLPQLIDQATEVAPDGMPIPLREELRSWIRRMVCLEGDASFRSLLDGQKAFGQLLQDGAAFPSSSAALQAFVEQCESAPWYQHLPEHEAPRPALAAPGAAAGEKAADPPAAEKVADRPSIETVGPFDALGPSEEPYAAPAETLLEDTWAPTPPPELRTLFEAVAEPRAEPPVLRMESLAPRLEPPGPAAAVPAMAPSPAPGQRAETDGGRHGEPWRFAASHGPAAATADSPAPAAVEGRASIAPSAEHALPSPPAPPPVRHVRRDSGGATAVRRHDHRASPFTPLRIALAISGLVVVVLLALAIPKFWGSRTTESMLVVESEPSGAEVTVDEREAGTTPVTIKAAPGAHKLEVRIGGSSRSVWVNVPEGGTLNQHVELHEAMVLSGLKVTTHPPNGIVSVNGAPGAKAPVRVSDLQPGPQTLRVEGPFGPVESEVTVAPGEMKSVGVATAGWVRVSAPFHLDVTERGRRYGNTASGPVMVPVGRHHFDLVNTELDLRVRQFVDVPAGETVSIPFEAPTGMMNLDADQPAEVWLDDKPLGQTPLVSVPVPLGPHQVVFRHAKLGQVTYSVVVTISAPVRLSVTFNKK